MIKFKEHDGLIFRMLDKPVPLTPDAEMPCLVRFIMPFSERFKGKHEGVAFFCDAIKKNPLYGNRLYAYETRRVGCIAEPRELEIIGIPVAEGSGDWAWHMMQEGYKIKHCESTSQRFYAIREGNNYCAFYDNEWKEVDINTRRIYCEFIEYAKAFPGYGWRILKEHEQPKPKSENIIHGHIPADMRLKYIHLFKVGDWVECKDFVGVPAQCKVLEIRKHNVIVECKTGHRWSLPHNNITRKLSPTEIIVNIGCMSGTVEKAYGEKRGTFILSGLSGQRNVLWLSMLDTQTRELVEGLLKAQEKECNS